MRMTRDLKAPKNITAQFKSKFLDRLSIDNPKFVCYNIHINSH